MVDQQPSVHSSSSHGAVSLTVTGSSTAQPICTDMLQCLLTFMLPLKLQFLFLTQPELEKKKANQLSMIMKIEFKFLDLTTKLQPKQKRRGVSWVLVGIAKVIQSHQEIKLLLQDAFPGLDYLFRGQRADQRPLHFHWWIFFIPSVFTSAKDYFLLLSQQSGAC